jgi:hypothetical protein
MAETVIKVNELLRDYETAQEAEAAARQDGSWTVPMVDGNDRPW